MASGRGRSIQQHSKYIHFYTMLGRKVYYCKEPVSFLKNTADSRKWLQIKKPQITMNLRLLVFKLEYYLINFLYFKRFGVKSPPKRFFLFSS